MKFLNKSAHRVTFTLRGREYAAEPGAEVEPEVPDKLAYAIKARGLPLDGPAVGDDAIGPPEHPEARLWHDRAHEQRRLLMQAAEENEHLRAERDRIQQELAAAWTQRTSALDDLRAFHADEIAKLKAQHEAELAQLTAPVVESAPESPEPAAEPTRGSSRRSR